MELFLYDRKIILNYLILYSIIFVILTACGQTRQLTVIDSGHTKANYGAISCTDRKEVDYNDDLVQKISTELIRKNRDFLLTRTKDTDIEDADELRQYLVDKPDDEKWQKYGQLYTRIALANKKQAGLFVSIHHDSVIEHRLQRSKNGKIIDVQDDFKQKFNPGYSIYIASDPTYPNTELHYAKSLKFAEIFAKKMHAIDRKPSTYHEEKPGQDHYQSIDVTLGIYNSKTLLAVLRNAEMPAVLIEAGVIVDVDDEKVVSSQIFKDQLAKSIVETIVAFFDER